MCDFQIGDEVVLVDVRDGDYIEAIGDFYIAAYEKLLEQKGKVIGLRKLVNGCIRVRFESGRIEEMYPWRFKRINITLENK